MSAAGEALQMLPASVARFRIWADPTTAAPSASASIVAPDALVADDVRHHGPGPDPQGRAVFADVAVELGDPLDVDDGPRPDRAVAEPDDQVGATGQGARLGIPRGEQGDGVIEAGRPLVLEGTHRG